MITEADTCRKYVLPELYGAGWSDDQINEQKTFTDGKIVVIGDRVQRGKHKRADYILLISRNFPIAVIEAKAAYKKHGDGLQQAKEYAEILGLKFAYSTNGHGIIEHDYITGLERELAKLPSPEDLWGRLKESEGIQSEIEAKLLGPYYALAGKKARYYQEIAINSVVQAVLKGKRRILLTLATGTGKTYIAFQVIWKLWNTRWNRTGEYRKPKVLYLADRSVLIDDPKDKTFSVFGDARWKITGKVVKSREIYFSTYQAIAKDEKRPGLYREYPPEFFDLIIVDECHRGSAREDSNWREILEYFRPAVQIGMTATPLRDDNRDTYKYFGNPIYTYSLKQGIEDGFLAPYRVHRVVSSVDAMGWRPYKGQVDKYGREVPDGHYDTTDFEYLAKVTGLYDADPFDLLCHVAFNAPLRTRRERAEMVKREKQDFFVRYGAVARAILNEILDKYVKFGLEQLDDIDILKVPPISNYGNLMEIADAFGGISKLKSALSELQNGVYAY